MAASSLQRLNHHDQWRLRSAQRASKRVSPILQFVRDRAMLHELALMGRKLDRSKGAGRFKAHIRRGIEFASARRAIGAQFVRDMIVDAWHASATGMVGYPMVNVRDAETGTVKATCRGRAAGAGRAFDCGAPYGSRYGPQTLGRLGIFVRPPTQFPSSFPSF